MTATQRWTARAVTGLIAMLLVPVAARAVTFDLEIKRLGDESRMIHNPSNPEFLFRMTHSQHFWMQAGAERPDVEKAFAEAIKKQPDKYECEYPFRCVADLGGKKFGLVLDSTNLDKNGYDRLYFDRNRNGDLTDDEVIEARPQPEGIFIGPGYSQREFPRIDLTLDVDGTPVDYSFALSIYANTQQDRYASASLNAAAYRQGKVTIDGKERRVFLIDFNSNGRFDDRFGIRTDTSTDDKRIWAKTGDMLLIDPDGTRQTYWGYDATDRDERQHVSHLLNLDDKFYTMQVAPAGDKITLTPCEAKVGHVTNPAKFYRAVLYNDEGTLKITGRDGRPVRVPEGEWTLLNYMIDLTPGREPVQKPEPEKPKKKRGLFAKLKAAIAGDDDGQDPRMNQPKWTLVSAQATRDGKPIKVVAGKTVELPFGPPYRPVVSVDRVRDRNARLDMSVYGSAGEICTNLMVNGNRPGDPRFAISAPDGEIVERGKFEYG